MAKKKAQKTNAARILDRLGIGYELLTYPVDENDLSANHVAEVTGIPPERIYKTLVVRGDRTGVFMAVIPGAGELDLKAAAAASGNKRAEMVHLKEVFARRVFSARREEKLSRLLRRKHDAAGAHLCERGAAR